MNISKNLLLFIVNCMSKVKIKEKTKKSCAKRIKITKNGVATSGVPFKRHLASRKSKRRLQKRGREKISKSRMNLLKRIVF
ncbi:hypothetical protein AB836_01540 [Rickettsiales bacterium (ex Bugula neritina AB1)]|nr:hypothetical protein AB836_01540 [Rickettsiales bacterium (ex Bugula neritina AB1)]